MTIVPDLDEADLKFLKAFEANLRRALLIAEVRVQRIYAGFDKSFALRMPCGRQLIVNFTNPDACSYKYVLTAIHNGEVMSVEVTDFVIRNQKDVDLTWISKLFACIELKAYRNLYQKNRQVAVIFS